MVKKLISYIFLICIFIPSIADANELPIGFVDGVYCDYLSGWACDVDDYSKTLNVHFYYDGPAGSGKWAGAVTADIVRESGIAAACGGNTAHGFKMTTPDFLKDGQAHTIYAYAINTPTGVNSLIGSGDLKCAPIVPNQNPTGFFDDASCDYLSGWACDVDDYSKTLNVHFYYDGPAGSGKWAGAGSAGIARESAVGGACGGNANHGFKIPTPDVLKDGRPHTVYAYAINAPSGGNPLLGTKKINCPALLCSPGQVMGCSICKSDGSGWNNNDSKCQTGQICRNGSCTNIDFSFGQEEVVFDWIDDRCSDYDFPDAPARAFIDDSGKTQLIAALATNYRFIGSSLGRLNHDCNSIMESDHNPDPSMFNDYEWLTSPYTFDGKNIYSLIHSEYHGSQYDNCNETDLESAFNVCMYTSMTSALSRDSGKTFTHNSAPNHLVSAPFWEYSPDAQHRSGYHEPTNIIKGNDGYYYVYITVAPLKTGGQYVTNQSFGTCIMRAKNINEIDGSNGKTEWYMWNGSNFSIKSVDPYRDSFDSYKQVCSTVANIYPFHSNTVVWNTYLNKYMMVGFYWQSPYDWLAYSLSDDLVHWSKPEFIRQIAGTETSGFFETYPSLIDPEVIEGGRNVQTRNFEKSDNKFYIYYTWKNQDLMRAPVTMNLIGKTCVANAISGCKVCKTDGSGWQDDNSKCAAGQYCETGVCKSSQTCVPKTCATLGNYQCGDWSDGCGKIIDCGSCTSSKTCKDGQCISSGSGGSGGGGNAEPQQQMTREEILQKIAEVKRMLIILIQELIIELQKQLMALPKTN